MVDLGLVGKVRPCLVLSDYPADNELALLVVVPHTTALRANRWEFPLAKPRPHLPKDFALNHGHYVRGEPKKRVKLPLNHSRRPGTVDLTNAQIEEMLD